MSPQTSFSLAANVSAVKRKASDLQLGPATKRKKLQPQEGSSTSTIPTSDNDRPGSDSEMLEPIDSFTVDLFGASLPSRSMTLQAKLDPVRRVIRNKLPSTSSQSSNIRIDRCGEQGRSSSPQQPPQQPPQSATTNASPYVTYITHISTSINAFVVSHLFRNHFLPQRRMQLRIKSLSHSWNTLNLIFNLYMKSDLLGLGPRTKPQLLLQQEFIIPILQPHRSKKSVSSCHLLHIRIRSKARRLCPKPVTYTWKWKNASLSTVASSNAIDY